MSYSEVMGFIAGGLQFIVAGYALRLNWIFGPARVGWSLFCAFLLLALLHLVQSVTSFPAVTQFGIGIEVMYALISLLLLTGMVHLETVLKERVRTEREERRMRAELELEVQKKTAFLTRAIEELQAEIDKHKRMEMEVETTHFELRAVSRQAELARIGTSVLKSVGDMLKSVDVLVNLVSDHMKQSKIANVVRVGTLIREHALDLAQFITCDPRGQKLPVYFAQLAEHLATEQAGLLNELASIKTNLEKIMGIQRDYAKLAGVAKLANVTTLAQVTRAQCDAEFPANTGRTAEEEVLEAKV